MTDRCDACGREFDLVYRVPNRLWAEIAPQPETLGPHIEHQGGGILCPDCAHKRAAAKGHKILFEGKIL